MEHQQTVVTNARAPQVDSELFCRLFVIIEYTKLLVQGVIMARIDYCNGLLYGVLAVHLSKLQLLQNSAARLITHTPRYCHITTVLHALHWLPVKFRIAIKSL